MVLNTVEFSPIFNIGISSSCSMDNAVSIGIISDSVDMLKYRIYI